jgi:signal transduction histidine kinase
MQRVGAIRGRQQGSVMVFAKYLPCQQTIADDWRDALYRLYPGRNKARIEAQVQEAITSLYKYLSGSPVTWDLRRLMVLLVPQPTFNDVTSVFAALRQAVCNPQCDRDARSIQQMSDSLDGWVEEVVSLFDRIRQRQSEKRWREMVQRFSQLNTLGHCVAELNTSLDLASVFTATVELARRFSGADLCVLYLKEDHYLKVRAYAGDPAPQVEAVSVADPRVLDQLTVDRNHHDIPLATVHQRLGIPKVCAVNCIPLQTRKVIIGKLAFAYTTAKALGPQELRLQEIFSNHAAQAIYNAQLYECLTALTAENERRQLACEIHDTLLQTLTALNLNLRVMQNHAQRGAWDEVLPLIQTAHHLGKLAIQEGRDTLNNLRDTEASGLERRLADVLQPEIDAFANHAAIKPTFVCEDDLYVPAGVSHHLCRLLGEALTNIHRHAGADVVQVTAGMHHSDNLSIEVRDNGIGFHLSQVNQQQSFGLLGMHERARQINAQVIVDSAPGSGTAVTINCPLLTANGIR